MQKRGAGERGTGSGEPGAAGSRHGPGGPGAGRRGAGGCAFFLDAEGEVAGVAEARDDVGALVDFGVNGADPDGGAVLGEVLGDVVDGGLRGDDGDDVDAGGGALGEQGAVAQVHRGSGSEHGVAEDEGFAVEAG